MAKLSALVASFLFVIAAPALAQVQNYKPVTQEMLLNPSPNDWLMYSRTYDAFRDSPLKQINKKNVGQLRMAWTRGLDEGVTETIPIVHDGVMYVIAPGGFVDALDATNGDLIWEYKRPFKNPQTATNERTKALAIYEDMVYFTSADGYVVALDARTGKVRWETFKTDTQNTSGALVIDGKVISGGTCGQWQRHLLHRSRQRRNRRKSLALLHRCAPRRSGLRLVAWRQLAVDGVNVGIARQLRSRSQHYLLGRCESHARPADASPQWQSGWHRPLVSR